jgi:hypothetical protein
VNVLSEPTLAISVGHRPANSRPADPTREYEPGSGASHDPAPVHRPHPPRSPPAVRRPWPLRAAAAGKAGGDQITTPCGHQKKRTSEDKQDKRPQAKSKELTGRFI